MADDRKTCDHPGCSCAASDDSDFCSVYCESAGEMTELACNCGHAGCVTGELERIAVV